MFDTRLLVHAGLAAMTLCLSATALQAAEPSNICNFRAFTADPDPAGTNVRSGPGTKNDILAVLPQSYPVDGDTFAPQFDVIGFRDGWFQIEHARIGDYGDEPETEVFAGPGWISSKLVSFFIEDLELRDAPSFEAKPVLKLTGTDWDAGSVTIETVHACQGSAVEVTIKTPDGQVATGWANDLCGSQVTTCP